MDWHHGYIDIEATMATSNGGGRQRGLASHHVTRSSTGSAGNRSVSGNNSVSGNKMLPCSGSCDTRRSTNSNNDRTCSFSGRRSARNTIGSMSCSRRNSSRGGTPGRTGHNTGYDIYAAYSEEDQSDVLPIITTLKQHHLTVYDPNTDALPNETLIQSWLEKGIERSKISVIFLTKQFVKNPFCRYQADHAVMKYATTKGRHRLVVVNLQSCKVPNNLKRFNCVYAWKFREQPLEQHQRIVHAIFAPKCRFRRGSLWWNNASTSEKLGKIKFGDIPGYSGKPALDKQLVLYSSLLFNINKVKFVLENCELKCLNENCTYRVEGHKMTEFYDHVQVCNYQQVVCRFCKQKTFRKNLKRHEETTCRNRLELCPNEACGRKFTVREMEKHLRVCWYREEECPNKCRGCETVFAHKDKTKHLEICEYATVTCRRCEMVIFRVDIEKHVCQRPNFYRPDELYQCNNTGCSFKAIRGEVDAHARTCEFRIEQCADCGMRLPYRDLAWHRRECDKMVECQLCHQVVPRSSKLTHDRWICSAQNIRSRCDHCHVTFRADLQNAHADCCDLQSIPTGLRYNSGVSASPGSPRPEDGSWNHIEETDSGHEMPRSDPIFIYQNSPAGRSRSDTYTFDDVVIGSLSSPPMSPPLQRGGAPVNCQWNTNSRQKWREMMTFMVTT